MSVSFAHFRDPEKGRELATRLSDLVHSSGRDQITIMHVCGSHEQAIARFGLRATFPKQLNVVMGPGCPVCVTSTPEVDEAIALAQCGKLVLTYGDMLGVPGSDGSLAQAHAAGAAVEVVYSIQEAIARATAEERDVVFFASGFETTAVTTAAALLLGTPDNFSVLSSHKYIPPVMEIVAEMPNTKIEGFLAAGHAATITGAAVFDDFVTEHQVPVVVAGFEPLDILASLVMLVGLCLEGLPKVGNCYPRCVSQTGNERAQEQLWRVFRCTGGNWRGIAHVPNGNLRLRDEFAHKDARKLYSDVLASDRRDTRSSSGSRCICGQIMSGVKSPKDCELFDDLCTPEEPVGACMVSVEGACRIWQQYGGVPDLR